MHECQYCGTELDDRYNFCLNCNRQVKCLNCGETLVHDKRICLLCGQPLVFVASEVDAHGPLNEFTLEENQTDTSAHRIVKGRFSDGAVEHIAALLSGLTRSRPVAPHGPVYQQPEPTPLEPPGNQVPEQTDATYDRKDGTPPETSAPEEQDESDKARALKYFRMHGDNEVQPKLVDFKGKSWKQQQLRFIILYVWAYNEILGRPVPSRANVTEAVKKVSNLYDARTMRRYYEEVASEFLLSTADEGLELSPRGFQFVDEVLAEMEDESANKGYTYWTGSAKLTAKKSPVNKQNEQEVNDWVDKLLDIGELDVRTLNSGREWAMFGVWSITKGLDTTPAVTPLMAHKYLTKKFRTVSVKLGAFRMAMQRNSNIFQKNADGSYYLTLKAEREVETWIKQGTVGEAK